MPSVDYKKVRLGCRATLSAALGSNLPPFVAENRSMTAVGVSGTTPVQHPDSIFVKEDIIKDASERSSMEYIESKPIVVYSVHYPVGRGTEVPEELAKLIAAAFNPSSTVNHDGYNMVVERTYQGDSYESSEGSRTDGKAVWYVCPVFIRLRLHVSAPL